MQIGIPPAIAVASSANQVVGASVSGCIAHWRRGNVDVKMGLILLGGGFAGSTVGIWVFKLLRELGQIERSEEHTSELQSLMRISYAVFCLKTKNTSTYT